MKKLKSFFIISFVFVSVLAFATTSPSEAQCAGSACCTVSTENVSVTICREDGNQSRACRQAVRLMKKVSVY